jgi:hypothetical protein
VQLDVPSAIETEARLRAGPVPVIGRVAEGKVFLDMRAVPAELDDELGALVARAARAHQGGGIATPAGGTVSA